MTYQPFHIHSHYDFLYATPSPEGLVARAKALHLPALFLTDQTFAGLGSLYRACEKENLPFKVGLCLQCRLLLLANGWEGLVQLNQLSTLKEVHQKDPLDHLAKFTEGYAVLLDPHLWEKVEAQIPKERLFVALHPYDDQNAYRRFQAEAKNIKMLASPYVRMLQGGKTEETLLRMMTALREGTLNAWVPLNKKLRYGYLMDRKTCEGFFAPSLLKETATILSKLKPIRKPQGWHFPSYASPDETARRLRAMAYQGFCQRYGKKEAHPTAWARFQKELEVVLSLGYGDYFLFVAEIVAEAKRLGFPCLGRGSAASSILSYLLGITPVDPIRYNLYFERFLNPERSSPPDIDLDFGTRRREAILRFIYRRFGEDRVAMISTFVRFAARGALRELLKSEGFSNEEASRITRQIPHMSASKLPELFTLPECRALKGYRKTLQPLLPLACQLDQVPRGWGIHCGGVVITPSPFVEWMACTRSANGLVITQGDMVDVEDWGLVKLDILGNRSLDVLPDTLQHLKNQGLPSPDLSLSKVLADKKTRQMIREGKTMGCFYIESPAMRQLLQKLQVQTFLDLVAASSIIRPGVAESGMMQAYIQRHHHPEARVYLHPALKDLLQETYGILVYQEDVMKVAHQFAGLSLAEADCFRRAMSGKSRSREAMERACQRFVEACRAKGIPEKVIQALYHQIASFAGYSFCKAHSAAFATLSFQVAYLKAHYPAAFFSAVLSNGGGFYPPIAYVNEARRWGVPVLPPDVNHAQDHYTPEGQAIRVGLRAVKGLGEEGVEKLLKERETHGSFTSVEDLFSRVPLPFHSWKALIQAGGLDSLIPSRRQGLLLLHLWEKGYQGERHLPTLPPLSLLEKVWMEWEALGFPLSAHPVSFLDPKKRLPACRIKEKIGKRITLGGILITYKRIRTKTAKERMAFLDMEDETGPFDAVCFPKAYECWAPLLSRMGPFWVEGRVQEDQGVPVVIVETLRIAKQA